MQKLHYSISINAPAEKVWHTMLDAETYPEWTRAFSEGSHFKGSWDKGSKIVFLGPDPKTGEEGGMVSRVAENKPFEFISLEHVGIVNNGVEDTTSDEARKWTPSYENYTFNEKDGATEVKVDMETNAEIAGEMDELWPKSLQLLKQLAEQPA